MNALAKRVGVTSTAAWNWDHARTTPGPDNIERVAAVLEVGVDYLKNGEEKSEIARPVATQSLADVLAEAKGRIASLLGVSENRVRLEMSLLA